MSSVWIGGSADGGLHERTPYWLNGLVPLAFLLRNAHVELAPVVGIYKAAWGPQGNPPIANASAPAPKPVPVDIMAQATRYISYILAHQNADGWLGPNDAFPPTADGGFGGGDYWGPSNVLQALWQWAEGSADAAAFANASQAVLLHLLEQHRRLKTVPLASWAQARWIDMAHSAQWLIDHKVPTPPQQATLLELIGMLHEQGEDWDGWFESVPVPDSRSNHNVNVAQGLKSAAVWSRFNASATYAGKTMGELSLGRMANLDATFGLPTGMYIGDEITPVPHTRSPSRGIELCGVVEAMYSYEIMFSVHGSLPFADRAERVAYNALPATWASPRGGDMWAHQYLQAINEIGAVKADPHVWQHDGDMAETYGLEPNFGCCTANFHQGWPKFANALFFTAPDGGVVVAMYAPASAALPNGGSVTVDTSYPFDDGAVVTVVSPTATTVLLRVPGWAVGATVNGEPAKNGTMWRGTASGTATFTIAFHPKVRLETWDDGAVSVHRGALLYSLPITPNYTVYAHHFGTEDMSSDYYLMPTTPWRFALDVNPSDPAGLLADLPFSQKGLAAGAAPFNHSNWPTSISAPLRPLPSWGLDTTVGDKHSAAPPPKSPACTASGSCGPTERHQLVPHGGTELRIGELPVAMFGAKTSSVA